MCLGILQREQNYCKEKGLRSCPCLVQMRELDFENRSNFIISIELACAKFWCLCSFMKETKIGLDMCRTDTEVLYIHL